MTFVTVGNATDRFPRLLDAVEHLAARQLLPTPLVIQSGNNPGFVSRYGEVRPFFHMEEFESHIANARVIISHAGAGTVLHALAAARVPVVMPRRAKYGELVDDHQAEFVEYLARAGRVIPAWEPADLPEAVRVALSRVGRPEPPVPSDLVRVVEECLEDLLRRRT